MGNVNEVLNYFYDDDDLIDSIKMLNAAITSSVQTEDKIPKAIAEFYIQLIIKNPALLPDNENIQKFINKNVEHKIENIEKYVRRFGTEQIVATGAAAMKKLEYITITELTKETKLKA